ncbi:hypothetical protein GCM10020358_82780 [Amorphoplanes nipponensis]|uniref:Uncharacterized protein n=2 Tax=Actinoplanes nipponensis TaxID=135950 RepID=A0A919MF56_9ACTN|nr:hypothetical protein Ani05nite_06980 [Actinoplanes nipponensis]
MDPQSAPPPAAANPAGGPADTARPAARRTLLRWGDTVVGAAFAVEGATTDVVAGLRRGIERLAERGATERTHWRQQAGLTAQAAVSTVATSPLVDLVVDSQLQRVLRPVVLAVLDDVLLLLEKEPERIQTLIRGQRESMVDELVGRLRAGARAGDTAVDRMSSRVFGRTVRPEPGPPLEL